MRRSVLLLISLIAVAGLVAPTAPARADHEDVIAESIPLASTELALELFAEGLSTPVGGVTAPYDVRELYLVDLAGQIIATPLKTSEGGDGAVARVLLDVGPAGANLLVTPSPTFDERGLLGLAFDPHYAKTGRLYTYTSEPLGPAPDFTSLKPSDARDPEGSLSVIREWQVDDPRNPEAVVDLASSRVLMRIEQPQKNHNAGDLAFGRDAMLYVALGDGGSRDDEGIGHGPDGQGSGQDLSDNNLLGKILRIDPRGNNGINGQYGIPADNPFVGRDGPDEAFAYGLRNPFRMSFDPRTGDLIAADVGQRDIEEVNIIVAGGNYGWPVKEGTFLFNNNGPGARGYSGANSPGVPSDMIDPIAQYDHDEGISITGGFVYWGAALPELHGQYIFGDWTIDGNLIAGRYFQMDPEGRLAEIVPVNSDDNPLLITAFGRDTHGELYVMGTDGTSGVVYRLVPAT